MTPARALTPAASTALYLATADWSSRRRGMTMGTLAALAALATGCAAALVWDAVLFNALVTQWNMNDFGKFYYATIGWRAGADLYAPNAASALPVEQVAGIQLLNMNPPHFHLVMLPLSWLSPSAALQVWMMGSVFACLLSVQLIASELGIAWTPTRVLAAVCGALLFSGTQGFFATGQVSLLMLLPMTAAWVAARRGQWGRAGLWLGACAGVKPFLLLFLPYLALTRRRRALAGACAAIAGSVLAGVAVFGASAHVSWLGALAASQQWTWFPMGVSLNAVFARFLTETPVYVPFTISPWLARLWVIPAAAIGLVSLVLTARPRATAPDEPIADRDPHTVDAPFATLLLAAQLMSPLGWVYYLWWVAGPLAALVLRGSARARTALVLAAAILALMVPPALTSLLPSSSGATLTVGSLYFWATLSLWVVAVSHRPTARRA
jgi:hypothetical protein